jgi:hypothetical protein
MKPFTSATRGLHVFGRRGDNPLIVGHCRVYEPNPTVESLDFNEHWLTNGNQSLADA